MSNALIADLVVSAHFSFSLFVVFGGLLVPKWRRLIWLHIPAVAWGVLIEFNGWICPLTSLENRLRAAEGGGYASGFIEHYLMPIIYPSELTRTVQICLGVGVIVFNLIVYR